MYGLQIQKLLAKKELLTDTEDKIKLIQQAIQISDSNKDVEWSIELRLELMQEEIDTQHDHLSMQAISWIIGAYEQDPTVIEEDEFLWQYKWVVGDVITNPEISPSQKEKVILDFSKRLKRNNYSLRCLHEENLRFSNYFLLEEEAKKHKELMSGNAVDDMSNCSACEQNTLVHYHLSFSEYDKAKSEAVNILNGKLHCNVIPVKTFALLTLKLTELNQLDEAKEMYERTSKELFTGDFKTKNMEFVLMLAYYLSKTDNKAAWELVSKYNSNIVPDIFTQYKLAVLMLAVLKNTTASEIEVTIPNWLSFYSKENKYTKEVLFDAYYKFAATIL